MHLTRALHILQNPKASFLTLAGPSTDIAEIAKSYHFCLVHSASLYSRKKWLGLQNKKIKKLVSEVSKSDMLISGWFITKQGNRHGLPLQQLKHPYLEPGLQSRNERALLLFTLLFTLFPIKCFEEPDAVQHSLMPLHQLSLSLHFFLAGLRLQSLAPRRNGNCRGPRSTGCQSQRPPTLACWVCWIWVWISSFDTVFGQEKKKVGQSFPKTQLQTSRIICFYCSVEKNRTLERSDDERSQDQQWVWSKVPKSAKIGAVIRKRFRVKAVQVKANMLYLWIGPNLRIPHRIPIPWRMWCAHI